MLKPLEDRLVVELIEAEQVTKSGFILAGEREKPQEAIVVAVNKSFTRITGQIVPIDVRVGDKVLFSKYGGTEVKHDGKSYTILSLQDILAIIEGEEE